MEKSAFDDLDLAFGDEPIDSALPHIEPEPEPLPPPPEPRRAPGGIAYITVTDAAGRVLFRRAATANEVDDALRSADTAQSEGEAAMDRIAYDRLMNEISTTTGVESIDAPLSAPLPTPLPMEDSL